MFSRIMPIHSAGGMQDHVQALSAGLAKKGHRVVVVTSGRADGEEFEIIDGVEIYFLRATTVGRYSSQYWFAAAEKFEQLHCAEPFDILHSQSVGAYGVYKKNLHRKYNLPLVTSLHGTHSDVLTTSWHTDFALTNPWGMVRFGALALNLVFRYVYRDVWFIRGSDAVIATSDADVGKYKREFRLSDSQIRKVYNGIDTDLFAPATDTASLLQLRTALRIPADEKIILALARLQKDKGVQNAIQVLADVRAKIPATLIVVGDGDYRAALEQLARECGIAEYVRFVGTQSLAECARYFQLCDVFVDPTLRTDGYDLTIAEAMACGKPVIASNVGANSTLIDPATLREGVLIPRGDNSALTQQTVRLLGDREAAQKIGKMAREKIAARFSIPAMINGMERVYQEMLTTRGRTVKRDPI